MARTYETWEWAMAILLNKVWGLMLDDFKHLNLKRLYEEGAGPQELIIAAGLCAGCLQLNTNGSAFCDDCISSSEDAHPLIIWGN